ncbi:MAG: hypothetical protein Fues2KO_33280 [Fuerstiella sp.]
MTEIFVGNLPYSVSEAELRYRFEVYGRVNSVRIPVDNDRRCRGFAFVSMPSLDDADEAIGHLAGADFGGRRITVSESNGDRTSASPDSVNPTARNRTMDVFRTLRGE